MLPFNVKLAWPFGAAGLSSSSCNTAGPNGHQPTRARWSRSRKSKRSIQSADQGHSNSRAYALMRVLVVADQRQMSQDPQEQTQRTCFSNAADDWNGWPSNVWCLENGQHGFSCINGSSPLTPLPTLHGEIRGPACFTQFSARIGVQHCRHKCCPHSLSNCARTIGELEPL
jgi:hypothetical protein